MEALDYFRWVRFSDLQRGYRTLRQAIVPDRILGRVNSVNSLLDLGAMPLGALLGGFFARVLGLTAPFWITAITTLGMAFVVLPYVNNSTIAEAKREA